MGSRGGLINLKRAQLELAAESHPAPWRACGQKLHDDDGLFACRHYHGLAYASQPQSPRDRSISWVWKIGMQLGGNPILFGERMASVRLGGVDFRRHVGTRGRRHRITRARKTPVTIRRFRELISFVMMRSRVRRAPEERPLLRARVRDW